MVLINLTAETKIMFNTNSEMLQMISSPSRLDQYWALDPPVVCVRWIKPDRFLREPRKVNSCYQSHSTSRSEQPDTRNRSAAVMVVRLFDPEEKTF